MEHTNRSTFMIIAILIVGNFLALINETVMNVALPKMIEDFNVSANTAQWMSTGYMLMIGIAVPVTAFFMQRFTTRQLFLTAMSLFTAGTLLAGIAPVFPLVLTGRIIQGSGTGLILPLVMNVILTLVPPQKRGTMTGMMTLVILFAPAIGPVISGFIVEHYSWRVVFFMMLPVALFMIIYAAFRLENVTEQTNPKIDILSIMLSTIGFGGIVFGFSNAGEAGWNSPKVVIGLAAGIIGLVLFVRRQLTLKEPMLDMRPFRSKVFSTTVVLVWLIMMLQFSMMLILPLYFQMALDLSPLSTGLLMLPGGLVLALTSLVAGRLFDKLGFRPLLLAGLIIVICVLLLFTKISSGTSMAAAMMLYAGFTLGVGFTMAPVMTLGLNQVPKPLYPHGSAIMNTVNQVSGAIGPALYTTILTTVSNRFIRQSAITSEKDLQMQGMTAGVHTAYFVAIGFAVVALALSFLIKAKNKEVQHM
ncbi:MULTISPECIES: MDR family MFS transporter [Bacillus]|uniref:DHA2 family efflux MFS transporter permease subunit n=1 Tax=Bacillus glycinifermentans TaxID=1664069 RepID=A0AAJ3YY44_9BACI|nr:MULTISPECIES: MDR family MFS transporter [Bacillus]KKB73282.1 multidrug MFS transporter [Bacillus sp. TH008]MDU0069483.1 DHA2 family efflux MFS transporter permease subunit [Bacillus sp. IG6]MED8017537.1 DHA2 family efflux MFS transporter permease subunit [Bacillus glycinifermentans]QAT64764.1 DHA2 family efflux MFS transporter permease subunit [Bacillus glycinifermentans]WKB78633.1 DHA2 family efflux MFS transporter permease subunit [Bacillus glycinifermentans]